MSEGETTVRLMTGADATQEVGMTIENIMKEKKEIIDVLANGNVERRLLIKELMITGYITGFFAGTASAHRDIEKTQSQ